MLSDSCPLSLRWFVFSPLGNLPPPPWPRYFTFKHPLNSGIATGSKFPQFKIEFKLKLCFLSPGKLLNLPKGNQITNIFTQKKHQNLTVDFIRNGLCKYSSQMFCTSNFAFSHSHEHVKIHHNCRAKKLELPRKDRAVAVVFFWPRRKIIDMIILLWQPPPHQPPHKLSVLAVLCFYRRGENVARLGRCGPN